MSEPLTLAEAVPLGTVHLQRLLAAAGIRSLVIKGPAFVELGVRKPRQSNDIDLLVAPGDRTRATESLAQAGWSIISHWFPPALDDVIYSTTFHHVQFPATLDLHHHFSGMLEEAAFEELWRDRTTVRLGHQAVTVVSREHAFIIEGLNAIKKLRAKDRVAAAKRVVEQIDPPPVEAVLKASIPIGARHTAAPLIEALGGPVPTGRPSPGYRRWVQRGARTGGVALLGDIVWRAPLHLPKVLWEQMTLSRSTAELWATANGVKYVSRKQVLMLRAFRVFRRL